MASAELLKAVKSYDNYVAMHGIDEQVIDAYLKAAESAISVEKDVEYGLKLAATAKGFIGKYVKKLTHGTVGQLEEFCADNDMSYKIMDLFYESLRLESAHLVTSFFRYIEVDEKDPRKRFYYPRMRVLKPVTDAYQLVYDGELDFLSVSQPKRTGKTTSGLKLCQMMGGRKPDGSIFVTGSGDALVRRFYDGLLETFENEKTYKRFLSVFPHATKAPNYKRSDVFTIDLGKKNVFTTFTCRPIDGAIVGSTEANQLVYIDDCVKNYEMSRNRATLDKLCEKIQGDILGRRIEHTPIVIQGTKYSLYDPITVMQESARLVGWRWKEVAIPALDPITDESNWEIEVDGKRIFTTDYYKKERTIVPEETWAAEFQQEPFEAKGRMFSENSLNYFEELPVDREPDAIMAACDSADKGEDSCALVVGYIYGSSVYVVDVVFDDSGVEHTKPECAKMLVRHGVKTVTFESNAAGGYFGRDVMTLVKEMGGRCSARYKYNCSNKITRMENARDNIIRDYYFKDFRNMDRQSQYYRFMREFTTMTRSGKVKHDDAPDAVALFENEMRNAPAKAESAINPFRGGYYGY